MFTLLPAHNLLTCDITYAHRPDILHIDPTLLLFLEDREIVYCNWFHVQQSRVRYA